MSWLWFIIVMLVVGLVAGALGRLIVPGKQDMSIGMTILLGVLGSFLGGFLGYLLFKKDASQGALQPAGWIGSIIGAVIVVFLWTRFSGRRSIT